jgi:hypothetical protein
MAIRRPSHRWEDIILAFLLLVVGLFVVSFFVG